MKIFHLAQGSIEWRNARAGLVTASEMHRLVTPLGKVREGDGPRTFLYEKAAEKWTGYPLPAAEFFQGDNGLFLEEYARPAFTLETGIEVETVGLIVSDDLKTACSPDGLLVGQECGLEIKSPMLQTHVGYLLNGVVPTDYVLQCQMSLYVTGFPSWKFFSFRRGLPPLILTVEPDPKIQDAIAEAMEKFNKALDEALDKLTELNGGVRPEPPAPLVQDEPTPAPEELQELTP
jgi:hypothetical protein